jgi:hypothetical protein
LRDEGVESGVYTLILRRQENGKRGRERATRRDKVSYEQESESIFVDRTGKK